MNKKFWGIIGSILTIFAFAGAVWGLSSFWHGYCSKEEIHEYAQAAEIKEVNETAMLAMQKSTLAVAQQRAQWLEEQLVWYERTHGCKETQPTQTCSDRLRRVYLKYLREYNGIQIEIGKLMKEVSN